MQGVSLAPSEVLTRALLPPIPSLPAVFEEDEVDGSLQERILELRRVTKVVKGGKLMGFRALAVVGNGAGELIQGPGLIACYVVPLEV